ncbi:hypothetical protein D5b_00069 [Faustovirus]|nr:hypothetical protein D5b_00069 [Faustovirus]
MTNTTYEDIDDELYIELSKLSLYNKNITEYGGVVEDNKVIRPGGWGCLLSNHIIGVSDAENRELWWRCRLFPDQPSHYHKAPLSNKIDRKACAKCEEIMANQPALTPSHQQSKNWRCAQSWYNDGKRNECELEQMRIIQLITGLKPNKTTGHRLHLSKLGVYEIRDCNTRDDGFEYTEDFDGIMFRDEYKYYFNLKFVCDEGGAQTRSLRLVYIHIKRQLDNLLHQFDDNHTYYINILDGDVAWKNRNKFDYLLGEINTDKKEFINRFMFIGDMKEFQYWWLSRHTPSISY